MCKRSGGLGRILSKQEFSHAEVIGSQGAWHVSPVVGRKEIFSAQFPSDHPPGIARSAAHRRTAKPRLRDTKIRRYLLKRASNSAWKVGFALTFYRAVLLASFQIWIPQLGDLVQSFYRDTLDLFLNGLAKGGVIGPMLQRGCIGAQGVFSETTSQADVS